MIIILSKDQHSKVKSNKAVLKQAKQFFIDYEGIWYKCEELEMIFHRSTVRRIINELRNEGMPIISDTRLGYKYTTNKVELEECYNQLKHRALVALTAAKMLKRHF